MSSQPENKQTALENVSAGGDINETIAQEIHQEPNKLAEKIGIVQYGGIVKIDTFNYNQIVQEAKQAGSLLNLPPTNVTFFAGRDDDLAKVHELLQTNQRVAVAAFIKGMGGVGKSELALQYALRHLLTDYVGGICWLRGHEGTLPTQLQDFVQVQFGETMPDGLDSGEKLAGHCWRRLSERVEGQMLVVLDDVKNYENVEPFLPPLEGKFRVLATTRLGLGNAMQQYTLDVLVLAAAVDLLKSFLPEADPRCGNDVEIEKLCEWLGRLPLAIELVGRYLARKPDLSIAKMQERLDAKKLQQEALTDTQRLALAEMTAKLNVAAAFDLSWQELSEGAQRLACLLSLFALAPIHWQWVMDAMDDVKEEDLETCRDDELLNLHLLGRTQQGVYELHQLLREYFQFQLKQHPKWSMLRQQLVNVLLGISKKIPKILTLEKISELTPAIPHLEMMSHEEMLKNIPNIEENLVWAFLGIARFFEGQSVYLPAINFYQNCIKYTKLYLGQDHLSVGIGLNCLGKIYNLQGDFGEAETLLLQSLSIFKQTLPEHHRYIETCLNDLANYYQMQFRYSESESYRLQSHRIILSVSGNDSELFAYSLCNLAQLYVAQEKFTEAEPTFLRASSIIRQKFGDYDFRLMNILNNWAELYKIQQNYRNAETLFLRSFRICEQNLSPHHIDIAIGLNNLAECYRLQNKHMEKIRCLYLRAIEISEKAFGKNHRTTQIFRANMRLL